MRSMGIEDLIVASVTKIVPAATAATTKSRLDTLGGYKKVTV
jgi:hypothetical protein